MNSIWAGLLAAVLWFAAVDAASARAAVLVDPGVVTVSGSGGEAMPAARLRQHIATAAVAQGWVVNELQPAVLRLTYTRGTKHRAVIDVPYADGQFQVRLVETINLNQSERDGAVWIHPNYNRWIQYLINDIRAHALQPYTAAPPVEPASAPASAASN